MSDMILAEANGKKTYKIVAINSGKEAKKKLLSRGLHVNDLIEIVSNSHFGPILIKNLSKDNAQIAIGRGIAEKIEVESIN
ncbi:MAG: FeoA family protein [Candidatus Kapaibacteriales bacterium]